MRDEPGPLAKLLQLRIVSWKWNERAGSVGERPGEREVGVIAQELEEVFPELVVTTASGIKEVRYAGLLAKIVGGVQELGEDQRALRDRIAKLEGTAVGPRS